MALIALLGTVTAFDAMSIDLYMPSFTAIQTSLGSDTATLQFSLSLFLIGLAAGQAVFGPLSDSFGRKKTLVSGILLFAASSTSLAMSPDIDTFLIGRFFQGLGGAAGLVIPRAVIADIYKPGDAARLFVALMQFTAIAPVIAPLLGGLILKEWGWRAVFWVLAAVGLAAAACAAVNVSETLPSTGRAGFSPRGICRSYLSLLRIPAFLLLLLSGAFINATLMAYIAGSPFMFMEFLGFSAIRYSVFFAITALIMLGVGQCVIILLRRMEARKLCGAGYLIHLACLSAFVAVALFEAGGTTGLVTTLIAGIATFALVFGIVVSEAMAVVPASKRGAASALLGVSQYLFGGGASMVLGLLHDGTLLPLAATMGLGSLLAALLYWRAVRSDTGEEGRAFPESR